MRRREFDSKTFTESPLRNGKRSLRRRVVFVRSAKDDVVFMIRTTTTKPRWRKVLVPVSAESCAVAVIVGFSLLLLMILESWPQLLHIWQTLQHGLFSLFGRL